MTHHASAAMQHLSVAVTRYRERGGHTEYVVEAWEGGTHREAVARGGVRISFHRFSDFMSLHPTLQEELGSLLPPKFPLTKRLNAWGGDALKKDRVAKLESYLQDCLAAAEEASRHVHSLPCALSNFLELSEPVHVACAVHLAKPKAGVGTPSAMLEKRSEWGGAWRTRRVSVLP